MRVVHAVAVTVHFSDCNGLVLWLRLFDVITVAGMLCGCGYFVRLRLRLFL